MSVITMTGGPGVAWGIVIHHYPGILSQAGEAVSWQNQLVKIVTCVEGVTGCVI